MTCQGCGNENAWHKKTSVDHATKEFYEQCDRCGLGGGGDAVPDVWWPGHSYTSEALGVEFTSRQQKAQYLKDHDLREAGDSGSMAQKSWVEGTRAHRQQAFEKEKPMIRQIYKEWLDRAKHQR